MGNENYSFNDWLFSLNGFNGDSESQFLELYEALIGNGEFLGKILDSEFYSSGMKEGIINSFNADILDKFNVDNFTGNLENDYQLIQDKLKGGD